MPRLLLCSACRRHVRCDERSCPFCAAALPALDASEAPSPRSYAGLGRAALFAFGASLGAAGCDDGSTPSQDGGPPVVDDGGPGGFDAAYGAPPLPPEDAGS
jgi:hypothetical protein